MNHFEHQWNDYIIFDVNQTLPCCLPRNYKCTLQVQQKPCAFVYLSQFDLSILNKIYLTRKYFINLPFLSALYNVDDYKWHLATRPWPERRPFGSWRGISGSAPSYRVWYNVFTETPEYWWSFCQMGTKLVTVWISTAAKQCIFTHSVTIDSMQKSSMLTNIPRNR